MDTMIFYLSEKLEIANEEEDIVGPLDTDDSAAISFEGDKIVLTTDSHTVDPIFFRGGNVGDLAICGTVNDLTVMGAQPLYLTLGLIIEEGYKFDDLSKIAETMAKRCKESDTRIVTGDTKVMPKGNISNCIINTAGIGKLLRDKPIQDNHAKEGDIIILTKSIGDHGTSLISLREGLKFDTDLPSDVASFWPYFRKIITNPAVHCMKDLTRGGLASNINEIALKSKKCLILNEEKIPIKPEAQAIADILGLEILEISCEGTAIIVVDKNSAAEIMEELRKYDISKEATIVGYVKAEPISQVHVKTNIGGTRILDKPYG